MTADTLVYFGALEDVALAAAGALRHGGRLIFTVEEATGDDAPPWYCLRPHGRYNHREAYVMRVLDDAGLTADVTRAELRLESGSPVAGLVVMATKAGTRGRPSAGRAALRAVGRRQLRRRRKRTISRA